MVQELLRSLRNYSKGMYTYVGSDVHHDKHIGLSVKISLKTPPTEIVPIINFSKGNISFLNKRPKAKLWVFFNLKRLLLV
jgi:hypothetical protein